MDLSIIIVSWNVKDLLRKNLQAIYNNTHGINFEVFVVDNDSKDQSAEMVQVEFPQVHVIANKENLGFAKANNQAIAQSKGRYVLLLNPDMRVHESTLVDMVKWMDQHPEAGVAGCHLIDENSVTVPHVRRFPRVSDQAITVLKFPHVFPKILNAYMMTDFDYSKEAIVDSIRGSFFMIRREIIEKIGGLDEAYFIWFEEVDYCKQVTELGYKIMYTPDIKCTDFVGKSFAQAMGLWKQKMFTKSMLTYFKKWHPWYEVAVIGTLRPVGIAMAWVYDRVKKK